MGACPLFCRRDDLELEILLHLAYRFLNPVYDVFGFCGMAFREAKFDFMMLVGLDSCYYISIPLIDPEPPLTFFQSKLVR